MVSDVDPLDDAPDACGTGVVIDLEVDAMEAGVI